MDTLSYTVVVRTRLPFLFTSCSQLFPHLVHCTTEQRRLLAASGGGGGCLWLLSATSPLPRYAALCNAVLPVHRTSPPDPHEFVPDSLCKAWRTHPHPPEQSRQLQTPRNNPGHCLRCCAARVPSRG